MAKYIEYDVALQFVYDACTECMESCEEFDGIYPDCHQCPLEGVKLKLRHTPAADVRPVVLCRDCVHFSEVMYGGTQFEYGYCDRWADGAKMNPDDFCSRAEKREES